MNKRNKIIVSIVGITIILLTLLGLTYAYYLTRIEGNTNTNSISVTTAKLELVYGDNSAEILTGTGALMPSTDLTSAGAIGTKTFTVTNNGNDSSYVVIIDNVSVTKASDGSSTSFVSNDFRYTLSCTKSDGTKCNEVNDLTIFPIKGGILLSNDIVEDDVHTYTLTLWYIDTGIDQSDDMGKTYQARVNIADVNQMENPFTTGVTATDNASLAYNIINNAKENKNGTKLLNTPLTKVAEEITVKGTGNIGEIELDMSSQSDWYYGSTAEDAQPWNGGSGYDSVSTCSDTIVNKYISYPTISDSWYVKSCKSETIAIFEGEIMEYESSLLTTQDDLGTSYYYRGAVEDNYVNFAGMCWRIVRIAGDGSTKLILEDQYTTCDDIVDSDGTGTNDYAFTGNWNIGTGNYGYELKNVDSDSSNEYIMNYLKPVTSNTSSMVKAFYTFQKDKLADYTSKLKSGEWCLGDKAYKQSGSSGSYSYTPLEEYDYSGYMYYDAYTRLISGNANGYQPTLKCNGTVLDKFATVSGVSEEAPMYVSTLTADEIVFAGGKYGNANGSYYLLNNYQKSSNSYFWSLSPYRFNGSYDVAFVVDDDGYLYSDVVNDGALSFRPSVSLASSAVITGGEGTLESPYIIG